MSNFFFLCCGRRGVGRRADGAREPNRTPKKIKHKRVNVKMAILKYYKVTAEGKVQRLRRECPTAECGAGVFVRSPSFTSLRFLLSNPSVF